MHLFPLLPKLALSLKASKMIFDQKNEGFLSSCFTPDEEIFVVLNPSEKEREKNKKRRGKRTGKEREKQCFLILGLLSHSLTGKVCCF